MAIFDGKLKQRLIGALVLIVLAVVFLPMIFNNRGEKIPETVVNTPTEPPRPELPANQASNQSEPSQPVSHAITTPPTANDSSTTTATTSTTTNTAAANTATPSTVPNKPVVSPPDANGLTPTWSVQVAAVGNLKNAEAFVDKLRKANYNAYVRSEANIHRVFVGPFIEKAQANKVQQQIQKQFNEKGIVVAFKPERQ